MTARLDVHDASSVEAGLCYLVSHGKSGGVGGFLSQLPFALNRGDRVVLDSARGREVGTVLCAAETRQARLLANAASSLILRLVSEADETDLIRSRKTAREIFEAGRRLALEQAVPVEILDVDVFLQDRAIVQFVGPTATALEAFAQKLGETFRLDIRLENLAVEREVEHTHGCDKPDCGKTAGGGCSTCATGGGCSSCGSGAADLRPYFAHLRSKMENDSRVSLV
jgi:cell fate regulator YaaT (PSP1 superfamily)